MFELEKAITNWRKRMGADPALEPGQIAEVESHLRDKVDDLTARGRTPERAFDEAVRALGEAGLIGAQFFKATTPRRSGRPSWQAPRFVPALAWNYVMTAVLAFRRSRGFTVLNIFGLAAGMAVFILIMLFVRYELSYDRFHANARRIFRVIQEYPGSSYLGSNLWALTPAPLGPAMAQGLPEVSAAARIMRMFL